MSSVRRAMWKKSMSLREAEENTAGGSGSTMKETSHLKTEQGQRQTKVYGFWRVQSLQRWKVCNASAMPFLSHSSQVTTLPAGFDSRRLVQVWQAALRLSGLRDAFCRADFRAHTPQRFLCALSNQKPSERVQWFSQQVPTWSCRRRHLVGRPFQYGRGDGDHRPRLAPPYRTFWPHSTRTKYFKKKKKEEGNSRHFVLNICT